MDARRRVVKGSSNGNGNGSADIKSNHHVHDLKRKDEGHLTGEIVLVGFALVSIAILAIANITIERYLPLPQNQDLKRDDFDYRNSRQHLTDLTNIGPRVVGSYENEILATQYIIDRLEEIHSKFLNKDLYEMQYEVFRTPGGSFRLQFFHEYMSVYQNISSVVLRILPKNVVADSAVLVNSHYDTVAGSPGAGDDTSSTALMLEMARAIVSSDRPLRNAVVFLWNGAEENMLQASHAFVTQHRWFSGPPRIAAFVNLDAAGSGGREIAFQIGPENPWLIEAYAKTVRLPWASIMAQEVFESGVIPSDTDYRQFRDYGRLPGVDVAFIQNGYVYHTEFDTPDRIANESLHRAGTNMLALIREIANSSLLSDPGAQRHGKVVFYDLLGFFMVIYPKSVSTVVNLLVCVLILVIGIRPKLKANPSYANLTMKMLVVIVAKIAISAAVSATIALLLTRFERHSMAWYSHSSWTVFVYFAPICAVQLVITALTRRRVFRRESLARLETAHFDAFQLLIVLTTVFLTVLQLGSAYLPMFYAATSLIVRNVLYERVILPRSGPGPAKRETSLGFLMLINFASYAPAILQTAYMNRGLAELIIPILGRSGSESNTEMVYGLMIWFFSIWIMLSQSSILYYIRLDRAIALCGVVFAAVFSVLCFTDLGFPFSADPQSNVYLKRIFMSHTARVLVLDDKVVENRTFLYVTSLDSEGVSVVTDYWKPLVDVENAVELDCDTEFWPYCAVPMIYPVATLMKRQFLFPAPDESYPQYTIPEFKLVETVQLATTSNGRSVRLIFECHHIPSHTSFTVTNRYGVQFVRWTYWTTQQPEVFNDPKPAYTAIERDEATGLDYSRSHYFTYYSYGTAPKTPFRLAVDFVVLDDRRGRVPLAEIALGASYMHKPDSTTPLQIKLREALPAWVSEVVWATHYDARTYYATLN